MVTLAFAGDVHFTGRTGPLLDDPDTAFGPIAPALRAADVTMLNLETAVTTRGTPEEKQYVFRAPPSAFDALLAAGVDVVSLANNHGLDYGRVGLGDTLASAEAAGMPLVGAGTNAAEAYAPWFTTVNGVRLAVFGFTQVGPANSGGAATPSRSGLAYVVSDAQIAAAAQSIRAAHKRADVVIIFMHWGVEREPCPTQRQRRTAEAFADAGATVVVGAHPHILQGSGWLSETYVAYSLGNFVWYSNTSNLDTGVLRLTLTGADISGVEFLPAIIDRTNGQPIPVDGAEAARIQAKLAGLRDCAGLSAVAPSAAAPTGDAPVSGLARPSAVG